MRVESDSTGRRTTGDSGGSATVSGTGVADRVASRLLDMIARGQLLPGQRLPGERQLAEQMDVSRVSVRAALQRLKAQGFLASVHGGGTRVVSSTADRDGALTELVRSQLDNLHDLAEIRLAIESWAIRRVAERATPEQLAEIKGHLDRMAEAEPGRNAGSDKAMADVQFHFALGRAADSPVYLHVLSLIRDTLVQMLDFHRYELFASADEDGAVVRQHRAIYDAIAAHDPDAAEAAMRTHLSWVLSRYDAARRQGGHNPVARA